MRFPPADKEAEEEANGRKRKKNVDSIGIEENSENSRIRTVKEEEEEEEEEELEEAHGEEEIGGGGGGEEEAKKLDEDGDGRDLTVRIDPHVLDCTVCFAPLRPPLYQCRNGHVMCSSCGSGVNKHLYGCRVCSQRIGRIRCLALEKVLESIKIPCSHATYGCKKASSYAQRDSHEESCICAPCSCPIPDCTFHGPTKELSVHFKSQHINSWMTVGYDKQVKISIERTMPFLVLCAECDHYLFLLLNDYDVNRGTALSVVCLQPSSSELVFGYDLKIHRKECELNLTSVAKNIRHWNGVYPTDVFLLVPRDFCGASQKISLEICITVNMYLFSDLP